MTPIEARGDNSRAEEKSRDEAPGEARPGGSRRQESWYIVSASNRTSAEETLERFDSAKAARKYRGALDHTATHRRESRCIRRALAELPKGSRVLDLPCGAGRLLPELCGMGLAVTAVDSSPHMVELARQAAAGASLDMADSAFVVASIFDTRFGDDDFDAVVCNRLFHHFREPEVRRRALVELRRICRGPIVASFFCSRSIDGLFFHLKQCFRRVKATDRIPISARVFEEDARASGLSVRRWLQTRPAVSKQWYAVLERAAPVETTEHGA